MLYYDRTHVSEGIDVNKTNESKYCDVCHYWYFLNKGFKSQPNIWNRYHDLLMIYMNLRDTLILDLKYADYCCSICEIARLRP